MVQTPIKISLIIDFHLVHSYVQINCSTSYVARGWGAAPRLLAHARDVWDAGARVPRGAREVGLGLVHRAFRVVDGPVVRGRDSTTVCKNIIAVEIGIKLRSIK